MPMSLALNLRQPAIRSRRSGLCDLRQGRRLCSLRQQPSVLLAFVEGACGWASNAQEMAVDIAELAGVAFLVVFYLWLLSLALKPIASLFNGLYVWLCDEAVRDRIAASTPGRAFLAAFFPFGRVQVREVTDAHRDAAVASLRDDYLTEVDGAATALARLLMDENRRLCEWKVAAIRAVEKKATSQIAAAGIILAVLAALDRSDLSIGYKAIPIAALVVAIMAYLKASYIRVGALPSFGHYLANGVIIEPLNEGRLAVLAAGAWHEYGLELEVVNETKARYVTTGTFWLVFALLMTLALMFVPGSSNATAQGAFSTPAPNDFMRNSHI